MSHDLSLDLKVARQQAGLTQADCAHLLGSHRNRIIQFEKHGGAPSLREACILSIILRKPFGDLFTLEFDAALEELDGRLETLAQPRSDDPHSFNRLYTLSALAERIAVHNDHRRGA